jgi:hypothetical protein
MLDISKQRLSFAEASAHISPNSAVCLMSKSLIFVRPSEIDFRGQTVANPSRSDRLFDSDGNWFVCGNDDGFFHAFYGSNQTFSFNVLPHYPTKLRVSASRKLICVGTQSGTVLVFELHAGKLFELLDLNSASISEIIVTSEFGFIVAFCETKLFAFTENGTLIYQKDCPFRVTRCCSFHIFDGRDFVLIATVDNEVLCFEVFRPVIRQIASYSEKVAAVAYSNELAGVIVVTDDGALNFMPFRPE